MHAGTQVSDTLLKHTPTHSCTAGKSLDNGQNALYPGAMRGGLERWKRGVESRGVRQAIGYALEGTCDAHLQHSPGVDALEAYGAASDSKVSRFIVASARIGSDELTAGGLRVWLTGHDPVTGEERGHQRLSPDADLLLDGALNHPKSYSIAALLHPELAAEFEALQDDCATASCSRGRPSSTRGAGTEGSSVRDHPHRGSSNCSIGARARSTPHIHRHLWLNIKVLGVDGKWSNLDSRVAMKLHTVVNAEGELAARTDPAWIAALARHGYTLDDTGEIAELADVVRPVSRRSAQIEGNRARLIAEWSEAPGGSAPSAMQNAQNVFESLQGAAVCVAGASDQGRMSPFPSPPLRDQHHPRRLLPPRSGLAARRGVHGVLDRRTPPFRHAPPWARHL